MPALNNITLARAQLRVAVALLVLLFLIPDWAAAQQMKLLSRDTGWVRTLDGIYWTTDGGDHWTNITPIPPGIPRPNVGGVFFRDTSEGWAVVSYGEPVAFPTPQALRDAKTLHSIAHTVNSGASWSFTRFTYPSLPQWIQDSFAGAGTPYFLDALHGWMLIGFEGNSRPTKLLATEDGGKTWRWVNGPGSASQMIFRSLQDGWMTSYWWPDRLYVTHNGCKTWEEVSLPTPPQVGEATFRTVLAPPVFEDPRRGFVVLDYSGHPGIRSKLVIYSTGDGGQSWEVLKVLEEAREAWGGRAIPFAIVDSAMIISIESKATNAAIAAVPLDGGSSDVKPSVHWLNELTFADRYNGWVVSVKSGWLATHDGGLTWKHVGPKPLYTPSRSWTAPAVKGPPMIVTHE